MAVSKNSTFRLEHYCSKYRGYYIPSPSLLCTHAEVGILYLSQSCEQARQSDMCEESSMKKTTITAEVPRPFT